MEGRAREAAERAIHSPLLDDVNLQGARGILVNITAGLDLSLGEFSEVGDTIEDFASEDATVVVGTVIDPGMGDELRVTVVATGLGSECAKVPLQVIDSAPKAASVDIDSEPDYAQFERPTAMRKSGRSGAGQAMATEAGGEEYFDIPAFLRRQAD